MEIEENVMSQKGESCALTCDEGAKEAKPATSQFSVEISFQTIRANISQDTNGKVKFSCQTCPGQLAFRKVLDFISHSVELHPECWSYLCQICNSSIYGAQKLAIHVKKHSINRITVIDNPGGFSECEDLKSFSDICEDSLDIYSEEDDKPLSELKGKSVKLEENAVSEFLCSFCGKNFDSKKYLNRHMKKHNQPFSCKKCPKAFDKFCDLRKHFWQTHGAKIIKCPYCKVTAEKSQEIIKHIQNFHEGRKESENFEKTVCDTFLECDLCKLIFVTKPALRAHTKKHLREPIKPICSICGQQFKSNLTLKNHMITHSNEKQFLCSYCGKAFSHRSSLKLHIMNHTNSKPYKCSQCPESFVTNAHLKQHERIHTGEKPYQCYECGKAFSQSGSIKRHMMIHSGAKPYECSQCGKAFNQASTLRIHLKTHSAQTGYGKRYAKPPAKYPCPQCTRSFTSEHYLNAHSKSHAEDGTKACLECNKEFPSSAHLKIHNRIHVDRPFKCTFCEKAFTHVNSLRTHAKLHSQENFKCDICGKIFAALSRLQAHEKTHSEKPLGCSRCDRGFTSQASLSRHELTHIEGKVYSCDFCGKEFYDLNYLEEHTNMHTREKPFTCQNCMTCFNHSSLLANHIAKICRSKRAEISEVSGT